MFPTMFVKICVGLISWDENFASSLMHKFIPSIIRFCIRSRLAPYFTIPSSRSHFTTRPRWSFQKAPSVQIKPVVKYFLTTWLKVFIFACYLAMAMKDSMSHQEWCTPRKLITLECFSHYCRIRDNDRENWTHLQAVYFPIFFGELCQRFVGLARIQKRQISNERNMISPWSGWSVLKPSLWTVINVNY